MAVSVEIGDDPLGQCVYYAYSLLLLVVADRDHINLWAAGPGNRLVFYLFISNGETESSENDPLTISDD